MKHTPGPWTVVNWGAQSKIIAGLTCIATTGMQQTSSLTDADASLISAAPDLLEACHKAHQLLADEGYPLSSETRKLLREAIAKAEGK